MRHATHRRVVTFFSFFDDDAACNPHAVSSLSFPSSMTTRRAIHTPCHHFLFPLRRRRGVQSTRHVVTFFSLFDDDAACNPHAMSSLSSPSSTTIRRATHRPVVAFFSCFDDDTACNPHAVSLLSSPASTTMRRAIHTPCRCFLLPLQRQCGVQPTAVLSLSSPSSTMTWHATHDRVIAFFSLFDDDVACNPHAVSSISFIFISTYTPRFY